MQLNWAAEVYHPSFIEGSIMVGSFGWFFLMFFIFLRLLPGVAFTEIKEAMPAPTRGEEHEEVSS